MAASRWTSLAGISHTEREWLAVAWDRVPHLANLSTIHYAQYICLYKSLATDLAQHEQR